MLASSQARQLTCVILDDEPLATSVLADYCAQVPFLKLVGTFHNAVSTLSFLQTTPVDLLFLDIHMPRLNGMQFVKMLPSPAPAVVFTTAHDAYAVQSYELNVVDYLLKPIAFSRFLQAANKASQVLWPARQPVQPEAAPVAPPADAMFVKHEQRLQRVAFDDILYVEGCKEYLLIYTPTEKLITLQSFRRLEEVLAPSRFLRVHKSFLVGVQHIAHIERGKVLVAGRQIPIGETYREAFTAALRTHLML